MAPLPKKTIHHFTHEGHLLTELSDNRDYLCDGCKTPGNGTRYRCNACDFDLHEYCAKCPTTASSFMHPQHQLGLVLRKPQATRRNDRVCDVCGDHVEGLFFRCGLCDFDVHPLCTQLPQHVRHVQHPNHPLTLHSSSPSLCMVCRNLCTSWRYRCGICCVDIHIECVLAPCECEASTATATPPPQSVQPPPPPPPYGGYYYGVPFGGYSPYHGYNHHVNQAQGGVVPLPDGGGGKQKLGKMMFAIVGKLALGVVTNAVFGISTG